MNSLPSTSRTPLSPFEWLEIAAIVLFLFLMFLAAYRNARADILWLDLPVERVHVTRNLC